MAHTTPQQKGSTRVRIFAGALAASVAAMSLSAMSVSASQVRTTVPTILLYNAQGYGDSVAAAFNKTHTNFKVQVVDDSTGPLITKIQAEEASGSPKWGMFWADGATEFAAFDKLGYLVPNVVAKTSYNAAGLQNYPADGSYAPTGLTATGAFCYDKMATKGVTLPTTWASLVNFPAGKLAMNDPSASGPTYPLIAGVMAHLGGITVAKTPTTQQVNAAIAKGEAFFLSLKKNGLKDASGEKNGLTLSMLESNPATIDAATIQSSACYGDINAKPKSYWPTGAVKYLDYSVALPSAIGVSAKLSPALQADAKQFVAYVTSVAGQQAMQAGDPYGDGLFWPVVTGVNPESYLPTYSVTNAFNIDPYVWGPLETQINTWWTNNIIN